MGDNDISSRAQINQVIDREREREREKVLRVALIYGAYLSNISGV
jgi:hypothetical protein